MCQPAPICLFNSHPSFQSIVFTHIHVFVPICICLFLYIFVEIVFVDENVFKCLLYLVVVLVVCPSGQWPWNELAVVVFKSGNSQCECQLGALKPAPFQVGVKPPCAELISSQVCPLCSHMDMACCDWLRHCGWARSCGLCCEHSVPSCPC